MTTFEEACWETYMTVLKRLYLEDNLSTKEVQAKMEATYGFKAT